MLPIIKWFKFDGDDNPIDYGYSKLPPKERKTKQVIVMRTDLNMRKGKMIAQGAHASLKVFIDNGIALTGFSFNKSDAAFDWLEGSFTKVCVQVNSEKELIDIYNKAKERELLCSLIQDSGLTEFGGIPTYTCACIGPNYCDEIDEITGSLKLL